VTICSVLIQHWTIAWPTTSSFTGSILCSRLQPLTLSWLRLPEPCGGRSRISWVSVLVHHPEQFGFLVPISQSEWRTVILRWRNYADRLGQPLIMGRDRNSRREAAVSATGAGSQPPEPFALAWLWRMMNATGLPVALWFFDAHHRMPRRLANDDPSVAGDLFLNSSSRYFLMGVSHLLTLITGGCGRTARGASMIAAVILLICEGPFIPPGLKTADRTQT